MKQKNENQSAGSKPMPNYVAAGIGYDPMINTDPFGSYTGLVKDLDEKPIQDADDL